MEQLQYDIKLDIATALKGSSKTWKNKKTSWSKLLEKLSSAVVTNETHQQFIRASKDEQGKIKDVGGYVGGYLVGGRRKKDTVQYKQLISLDIDFSSNDLWWDFTLLYDCAACIHSTHKSTPDKPRHRLIIPLSREVTPEEYEPIARKIAGDLNIDLFDQTTFEINRLMFWPSVSSDIEYYFEYQDGPILDADEILNSYTDWHDIDEWPRAESAQDQISTQISKQEDPTEKNGIIGVFCRTHTIDEVIELFLSDVYTQCGEDRYTYVNGTTSGGLITYDGLFAYSHHSTDPAGGRLCNAFDLVRIHKFGHLDKGNEKDERSKASFKAMEKFATDDPQTRQHIAEEKRAEVADEFKDAIEANETEEYDPSWTQQLTANTKGEYESTSPNLNLIMQNDPIVHNSYMQNKFDGRRYLVKNVPWRKLENEGVIEPMKDLDFSGLRNYIESVYGISSTLKVDDAFNIEVEKHAFHPIRDYILSDEWDGTNRVDTLLIDYFGADDTLYTRAAIRKALCAAVARIFKPGTKYDMVLILVGKQGTFKSTFIKKLGVDWFSDTFYTMQGKDAYEQLQGAWIIEMAELSALKKSESEAIKQFISKNEDSFRPAYGRTTEVFKRQCVFFGTTNDTDFLKDPTGNRRFNPVDIHPERATKSVPTDMTPEVVQQIWAEAYQIWQNGELLYFDDEVSKLARKEQSKHSSVDDRKGLIEDFITMLLPDDWYEKDIYDRRTWLDDPLHKAGTLKRTEVCVAEIWCECMHKEKQDMSRYNTKDINDMLRSMQDWEFVSSTKMFPPYGKQKYYRRKETLE